MSDTPVTNEECKKNTKTMTEKIDNLKDKFTSFELNITKQIAELPEALEEKFDSRYADKHTESEVDKIQANMNRLMWIVVAGVMIGVLNLVIK